MRRCIFRAVILAGIAIAVAAYAQPARHWGQFWGTWVWQISGYTSGDTIPTLVTFHIDGTVTTSAGNMFGTTPNAPTRVTAFHGVWERTGWQSAGGTTLFLIFSATGGLTAWGRSRSSLEFSADFDHLNGKVFVERLPCAAGPPVSCPDPLDPAAKWVPSPDMPRDGFTVSGARLNRVAAGPLNP
jgi:hypothetical protein